MSSTRYLLQIRRSSCIQGIILLPYRALLLGVHVSYYRTFRTINIHIHQGVLTRGIDQSVVSTYSPLCATLSSNHLSKRDFCKRLIKTTIFVAITIAALGAVGITTSIVSSGITVHAQPAGMQRRYMHHKWRGTGNTTRRISRPYNIYGRRRALLFQRKRRCWDRRRQCIRYHMRDSDKLSTTY